MFGKKINSKMLSGANSAYSLMTVDSYIRKDYKTDQFIEHVNRVFWQRIETSATHLHIYATACLHVETTSLGHAKITRKLITIIVNVLMCYIRNLYS